MSRGRNRPQCDAGCEEHQEDGESRGAIKNHRGSRSRSHGTDELSCVTFYTRVRSFSRFCDAGAMGTNGGFLHGFDELEAESAAADVVPKLRLKTRCSRCPRWSGDRSILTRRVSEGRTRRVSEGRTRRVSEGGRYVLASKKRVTAAHTTPLTDRGAKKFTSLTRRVGFVLLPSRECVNFLGHEFSGST